MLLTDFLIFRPFLNLYLHFDKEGKKHIGSSLDHQITIHHADIDVSLQPIGLPVLLDYLQPRAYFLVQTRSHIITRQCGIIDGHIFDERRRCILTYRQQNFIQTIWALSTSSNLTLYLTQAKLKAF